MRFALIALLILFVSCKDDDVYNGNYEAAATLLYSNNAKCEELALKYHSIAVKEIYNILFANIYHIAIFV
jgi:hypothetical protein